MDGPTLVALKAEIDADPNGVGYATMSDVEVRDALNDKNSGPMIGDVISGATLWGACELSEHKALSTEAERTLNGLFSAPEIDLGRAQIRGKLRGANGLFGANSVTAGRINAFVHKTSRAKELGLGKVTTSDVDNARALP